MFVDRTKSGDSSFSALFSGIYYAPLSTDGKGEVKLRILLDWSSVEVFGGRGESTITAQIVPDASNVFTTLFAEGGAERLGINVRPVMSAF